MTEQYKSPLHEMTQTTATCLWNDSCSAEELTYSIRHGAVGATCNPMIVLNVLSKEMHLWKDRIRELIEEMGQGSEEEIGGRLVEEMSIKGAELLKPIFDKHKGKNGRLSIQTDPRFYRNAEAIVAQAIHFSQLAPNMIVKIPVTNAGVAVFKKTYRIFKERGYRLRLLSAAFRNHMHWSEFIGGDVVISPPYKWQLKYNASDVEVTPRIDKPVDPAIIEELSKKFVDFRRAYEADGMQPDEFDGYGATARTLRQFIQGSQDLAAVIRDFMLPNPDM